MKAEKAKLSDVPQIHKLVNGFGSQGMMLLRPLSEIYENIRDFFVVRDCDRVIGCGALHILWGDLIEIKSVAVSEDYQRKGVGAIVVNSCLEEAQEIDVPVVFVLTYKKDFFAGFGFMEVDKMELPRKVWGECQRCPKYPDCDEIAMVLRMKPQAEAKW